MKYRGIFEYEYPAEHKPPVSIDVHLHGDCVKGKIIEWEYRSLDQEPKTGHWISTETKGVRYAFWCRYKCSLCGGLSDHTNFCPNCGAKMVEPQESEDKE